MVRIFVYGSLREGHYNYDAYLKGKSQFISYGYVKGDLYTIEGVTYPALIEGEGTVIGEIYEVNVEVAKAIDELESYVEGDPSNEYNRILCDIMDEQGKVIDVLPVYMFNMQREGKQGVLENRIESGDYTKYRNEIAG